MLVGLATAVLGIVIGVATSLSTDIAEHGTTPHETKIFKYYFGHGAGAQQATPPVIVDSVNVQRNNQMQGNTYVFPEPLSLSPATLSRLDSGSYNAAMDAWARKHGGVDPNWVFIQIVVSGNRSHTVRIIGMQVEGECSSPFRGTIMDSPTAGADYSQYIGFNLDEADINARNYTPTGKFGDDYFLAKTISLESGEQQTLEVVGKSFSHYCQFAINLTVLDGQKKTIEVIKNGGQLFKVSGTLPDRDYEAVYTGGVCSGTAGWVKANPRKTQC